MNGFTEFVQNCSNSSANVVINNVLRAKCETLHWRHNDHDGVWNHQPHGCLLNRLFRRRSKQTSKLRVTGLSAGEFTGTGEFPAQRASNAENVSIWWRHHGDETPLLTPWAGFHKQGLRGQITPLSQSQVRNLALEPWYWGSDRLWKLAQELQLLCCEPYQWLNTRPQYFQCINIRVPSRALSHWYMLTSDKTLLTTPCAVTLVLLVQWCWLAMLSIYCRSWVSVLRALAHKGGFCLLWNYH